MKSVAITGSFASGKSFVLKYLEKIGYKVFSCDDYVRQLYLDLNVQQDLIGIFDKIGKIFDKNKLIVIIYNDDNERKRLENYIHPKVRAGINDFKNKYIDEQIIFVEVPLLFETGFYTYFDYSICTYCDEENREKRAKERGDFNPVIYNKIKNIQLPQEEKKKLADFQVDTDRDIEVQVTEVIRYIIVKQLN